MSERRFREGDTVEEMRPCRKRPVVVHARKMAEAFIVETREGEIRGRPGDYLMRGVQGEYYPCAAGVFETTYDFVGAKDEATL